MSNSTTYVLEHKGVRPETISINFYPAINKPGEIFIEVLQPDESEERRLRFYELDFCFFLGKEAMFYPLWSPEEENDTLLGLYAYVKPEELESVLKFVNNKFMEWHNQLDTKYAIAMKVVKELRWDNVVPETVISFTKTTERRYSTRWRKGDRR